MPHLEMPQSERLAEQNLDYWGWLSKKKLELLLRLKGVEFEKILGNGAEYVVLGIKDGEKEIAAAYKYADVSPSRAKEVFYLQRIFSTLFPHNFPRFYASFASDPGAAGGTLRERIHGRKRNLEGDYSLVVEKIPFVRNLVGRFVKAPREPAYPFRNVQAFLKSTELFKEVGMDDAHVNFMIGEDGGEYYVDTIIMNSRNPNFNGWMDKIVAYMDEHGYSDRDKSIITQCIDRIRKLYKQE